MSEKNAGRNPFRWGTGAILLLALALRWPVPTPAWTHFDEIAFIVLPLGFWSGDLNPHYFNYPTFHFYLSSFLYLLYYLATSAESVEQFVAYHLLVDGRDLLALVRGANTLLAVATVGAVACLGRRLYGVREGLLAALILATIAASCAFCPSGHRGYAGYFLGGNGPVVGRAGPTGRMRTGFSGGGHLHWFGRGDQVPGSPSGGASGHGDFTG